MSLYYKDPRLIFLQKSFFIRRRGSTCLRVKRDTATTIKVSTASALIVVVVWVLVLFYAAQPAWSGARCSYFQLLAQRDGCSFGTHLSDNVLGRCVQDKDIQSTFGSHTVFAGRCAR